MKQLKKHPVPENLPSSPSGDAQQVSSPAPATTPCPRILVGIDWADQEHAYQMLDPNGQSHAGTVQQTPEALGQLIEGWRKQFPGAEIHVCLETSRGPLVNALLDHPQVRIYPVNPNALANYRKAFAHGGGKNDPVDAGLILQFLLRYGQQLQPLQPNTPQTRELAALCQDRRSLVEQRVVLTQQLKSLLKAYFPAVLATSPAKIYADFVIRLLLKYPTLADVQVAGRNKLHKLFFATGTKQNIEQRLDMLINAQPLSNDEVLLPTSARHAQAICGQLASLNQSIRQYDQLIEQLVKQHGDYDVVRALPCGAKSKARILAALGDDRARYAKAEQLAAASGIAPLTTQSGKRRYVSSRWACSRFLRQTFHEFAGVSIKRSRWAKAFYDSQRRAGKSAQVAFRALAYKWLRIIYRCWQTGECYDEERYIQRLIASNSPLSEDLQTATS